MKTLKLNQMEKTLLSSREMNRVRGGSCGCACLYENNGGSSTADNKSANAAKDLHSPGMIHIGGILNEDGSWTLCDKWVRVVKN